MTDVAIVDYGVGNLFSVMHACERVGLHAGITSDPQQVRSARAVILPGVGAFGAAMESLQSLKLEEELRAVAASGRPLLGICLGLQLLFEQSHEFGMHEGLGVIPGDVVRLNDAAQKVPHVGWSAIRPASPSAWAGTLLDGISADTAMYFVHSFYVRPKSAALTIATSVHGGSQFCAAVQLGNVFACQFHPERSGVAGLRVYQNLAERLRS